MGPSCSPSKRARLRAADAQCEILPTRTFYRAYGEDPTIGGVTTRPWLIFTHAHSGRDKPGKRTVPVG